MAEQDDQKVEEVPDKGPRVYVSGTFECLSADTIETFKSVFRPIVAITNKEQGCIQYNLYQDNKNECIFTIFEEWECQADLDAHSKGSHLAPVRSEAFSKIAKSTLHFCKASEFLAKSDLTGMTIPTMDIFTYNDGPSKVSTSDLFSGKKVVVFAVPGAFTPTCQEKHAPSFVEKYDEFKKLGVDKVYCLAVNDPFVCRAFVKNIGGEDKLDVLCDFDAAFCTALGNKTIDGAAFGLGTRAMRFSFIADNGVIQQYFEETDPGEMVVAGAETLIEAINVQGQFSAPTPPE